MPAPNTTEKLMQTFRLVPVNTSLTVDCVVR